MKGKTGSSEYQGVTNRGTALGILRVILAIAIIYPMVVKSPLWA